MSVIGLSPVLKGAQFDFREAYLDSHRSCELYSEDEASVGLFPYISSSVDVRDIPSTGITTGKRKVSDIAVKKWVGVLSVVLKDGNRKTLAEGAEAVS